MENGLPTIILPTTDAMVIIAMMMVLVAVAIVKIEVLECGSTMSIRTA
jgi:hypothetical protein